MEQELISKFKENQKLYDHLKQNSQWIKMLNRNPYMYKQFEDKMKEIYKERATDKMDEVLENIDLVSSFLNAMK